MRTRIIGRVGESAFSEALRTLRASNKRRTLIVAGERGEAILHFAGASVQVLATGGWAELLRRVEPSGTGPDPKGGEDVAPFLAELARSFDAVFELREGALPASIASAPTWLPLPGSAAEIAACIADSAASGGEARRERSQPLARIAALSAALAGARAKHVLARELGELWLQGGSPSRASQCFREAARSCLEWEEADRAFEFLSRAIESCPLDLSAAEGAIALSAKCGRGEEGEILAEKVFLQLEAARQYGPIATLYRAFGRRPRSSVLRRLGGEGLVRAGQTAEGARELIAAGRSLEAEGDFKAATRIYERVLAVEPGAQEAQRRLRRIRSLQAIRREIVRWGTLVFALLVAAAWFLWDATAASALNGISALREGGSPHEALAAIRAQAGRYPLTRHAERLRKLEASLYAAVFPKEREALARAIEAKKQWDLDRAEQELAALAERGIVPQFRDRAAALLRDIRQFRSRAEERLQAASAAMKLGQFEEAFYICREILEGVKRETFASGWLVPALVESVPDGADVIVGRESVGKTPLWVKLPAARDTLLRIEAPGYESDYFVDPLGRLIDEKTHRLRAVLELPAVWKSCSGGGVAAAGVSESSSLLPVMGADGVLRGFDPRMGRCVWQAPLEIGTVLRSPILSGPAVLMAPGGGKIVSLRLADGSLAWGKSVAPLGIDVLVGPAYAGQILVTMGRRVRLLSPLTGLFVRDVDVGGDEPSGIPAVLGDVGLFPLRSGGVAGANLRTGKLEFVRWKELGCVRGIASAGSVAALLYGGGRVRAAAPSNASFLWEKDLGSGWTHLAAARDLVWVGSADGKIVCFDARSGSPLWRQELGGQMRLLDSEGSARNYVFVHAVRSGRVSVTALSARKGGVRWEKELGPEEVASTTAFGDFVLVSSPSRGLFAVRIPSR